MALFSRHLGSDASFHPLFRLLDDYETYSRGSPSGPRGQKSHLPSFQPKFDIRELEDAFELHGELAGVNKENVNIEFIDPHTLQIRGRVERSYTSGTPPAGLLLQGGASGGAATESDESPAQGTAESGHKATVEDENTEAGGSADAHQESTRKETAASDTAKFWLSERSVGEFSRSFNFPIPIQQQDVTANLKDGVLTVRVPKAPKNGSRHRIQIN